MSSRLSREPAAPWEWADVAKVLSPKREAPLVKVQSSSPPKVQAKLWKAKVLRPQKTHHVRMNQNKSQDTVVCKQHITHPLIQSHEDVWRPQQALPLIKWDPAVSELAGPESPVPWRCKMFPTAEHKTAHQTSPEGTSCRVRQHGTWRGVEMCQQIAAKLPRLRAPSPGHGEDVPWLMSGWKQAQVQMPGGQARWWPPGSELLCRQPVAADYTVCSLAPRAHSHRHQQDSTHTMATGRRTLRGRRHQKNHNQAQTALPEELHRIQSEFPAVWLERPWPRVLLEVLLTFLHATWITLKLTYTPHLHIPIFLLLLYLPQ